MRSVLPIAVLLALPLAVFLDRLSPPREPAPGEDNPPVTPTYSFAEMRAIARRSEELEDLRIRTLRFGEAFAAIRADLWRRKVGPFEAADWVLETARELSPGYARTIAVHFPQLSRREATVASILSCLPADLDCGCAPRAAAVAVWEEILCDLLAGGEASPELVQALATIAAQAGLRRD